MMPHNGLPKPAIRTLCGITSQSNVGSSDKHTTALAAIVLVGGDARCLLIKPYFFGFVGAGAGGRVVTWDVVFCPPF